MFWEEQLIRPYKRVSVHTAKAVVIDTYLFFKNRMIYKIHVYFKTLSLVQLMQVDLNMCLKLIKQNTKSTYEGDIK